MALLKKTQRSFSGGMIDKDLTGRQDLAKYAQGCLNLTNFKVRKQGNVVKRSGTDLVCDFSHCLGTGSDDVIRAAKIVPLVQEREAGLYVLITGGRAFLVSAEGMKMNDGSWSRSPAWSADAAWSAVTSLPEGHALSGQPAFSSSANVWSWTDNLSNVWTASGSAKDVALTFSSASASSSFSAKLGASSASSVPYSIAVPFADADLRTLDHCQSGDTVFFAHRSVAPCKITYDGGALEYGKLLFRQGLGTPPTIASVEFLGTNSSGTSLWSGTGGEVQIEYAVTAVKDGVETGPSVPFAATYNSPWPTGGSVKVTIDASSVDADSFDAFYVYKKEADVFGLVGTTSNQTAFVDLSDGFSVNGSLYPAAYTSFDKELHLRESGSKFASVSTVTTSNVTKTSNVMYGVVGQDASSLWTGGAPDDVRNSVESGYHSGTPSCPADSETVTSTSTARSATAQKSAEVADGVASMAFTVPAVVADAFKLRVGSLEHSVDCQNVTSRDLRWWYLYWSVRSGSKYYRWCSVPETLSTSAYVKWTGQHSDFTPCPAKFFAAAVEYNAGTDASPSWVTSSPFDCSAAVDQSALSAEWVAQTGSSAGKWRRTYAESEYCISYSSASEVLSRMDSYAPSVPAVVSFSLPDAIKGKKIRKVTVYGYSDSTKAAAAAVIANGFSCWQGGKYVYSFTDEYVTPDLTITPPKTEDHFLSSGEWPACVQLYQQRLVYASSAENPFTFWMSQTGDLTNFDVHEYVRASDAITASTAALEMPRINRMLVHRDLMLFAEGGEWQVAPSSGNAVAPSTVAAKLQSAIGCAAWVKPFAIGTDIVFCDASGESLMAARYNFASDGYESSNLSVLSQRLFRNNPVQAMAYAQFPESTVECVLADGSVAALVYMKEHEVCAWSRNVLGGGWKALDVASDKSAPCGSTHVAFVAKRSYDVSNSASASSSTVTEWAVLAVRDVDPNDSTLLGNLRMDAVRVVSVARSDGVAGTPPTPGHGETCVKIGETRQSAQAQAENASASASSYVVTADRYALGCEFSSVLKTTSPEFSNEETAQMEIKNATEAEVRVIDASPFSVRLAAVPAEKAAPMSVPAPVDETPADFTVVPGDADCKAPLVGVNSADGSIVLEHSGHLPLAVLSVSVSYRVEYANHGNPSNGR